MAVITISRELGSGGDQIVDMLCEQLGYCRVDKAMLTQIAQQAGVDVEAVLEKEKSVAQRPRLISDQMTSLYGRAPSAFSRGGGLDDGGSLHEVPGPELVEIEDRRRGYASRLQRVINPGS